MDARMGARVYYYPVCLAYGLLDGAISGECHGFLSLHNSHRPFTKLEGIIRRVDTMAPC